MSQRLLLAGYFACGNLGDDAILLGFCDRMRASGHPMQALAGNTAVLTQLTGLNAIPRMEWPLVKQAIEDCDWLVFPGGSIFQDVSSVRSVLYYSRLVKLAKEAGKKVALVNQGIGPLKTMPGRNIALGAFRRADLIVVRDPASGDLLRSLGVKGQIHVGADSALLLPSPSPDNLGEPFGAGGLKTIGVSVRPWGKDKGAAAAKVFSELFTELFKARYLPVLIEMDRMDRPMMDRISKEMGGKVLEIKNLESPQAVQQRMARMEAVIAMRLHAGILAVTAGVPPFMVSYDPKVAAFANQIGAPTPPSVEDLQPARLVHVVQQFLREKEVRTKTMLRAREDLRRDAESGVRALESLLG